MTTSLWSRAAVVHDFKIYNALVVWIGDGTQCWLLLWHVTDVWSLGSCCV